MRLIKVGCENYKRFRQRSEMDVDEKLIAIVGPNEAGKSSFLDALVQLESDGAFPTSIRTRGASKQARVWARFVLDDEDKAALQHIPEARHVRQFVVAKSDQVRYTLEPNVARDLTPRETSLKLLDRAFEQRWLSERASDDEILTLAQETRAVLASSEEDLENEGIATIERLASLLESENVPRAVLQLPSALRGAHSNEGKRHPWHNAVEVLIERRPRFLLFEAQARDLRSSYNFDEEPNTALHNLLALAKTNWSSLRQAAADPGALEGVLEQAREQLDSAFRAWTQEALIVRISVANNAVSVMVRMAARSDYLGIQERSDGLRQFVALCGQVASRGSEGGPPTLLIDEADMHLHYNAQADLIQVLEEQEQAAKVIYTTHSAGCLPQDLGRGIRLIVPQPGTDDSKVVNWFWTDEIEGTGFSPILMGMGASALAFASTRRAVIGEGASEAILLPTVLREANGLARLDYQVAPGLANVDATAIRELDLVAARVAYVLDGDAAGDAKEKLLIGSGVPKNRILRLGTARSRVVLEDLLKADVYLAAVNEELGRWHADTRVPANAIPPTGRPAAVKAWCAGRTPPIPEPSKRAIAQRVLDQAREQEIVAPNRRETVRKLHREIEQRLSEPSHQGS